VELNHVNSWCLLCIFFILVLVFLIWCNLKSMMGMLCFCLVQNKLKPKLLGNLQWNSCMQKQVDWKGRRGYCYKGLRLFILRIQLAKSSEDLRQRCDDRNPSKVKILWGYVVTLRKIPLSGLRVWGGFRLALKLQTRFCMDSNSKADREIHEDGMK